jgi:lipid II:glycine glycyltransferase (peptidoglycan interpeptide bridge formation enzyme)
MQLAHREGLAEFDLGGVDVAGQRTEPRRSDPMYGLYAFKRSFGGTWVELTGNHERVERPLRYLGGRIARHVAVAPTRISAVIRGRIRP